MLFECYDYNSEFSWTDIELLSSELFIFGLISTEIIDSFFLTTYFYLLYSLSSYYSSSTSSILEYLYFGYLSSM